MSEKLKAVSFSFLPIPERQEGPSLASKKKKTKTEKDFFLRALFPALNMRNNFSRGVQSICDSGGEDVLFA